jgi:hypothetical protein
VTARRDAYWDELGVAWSAIDPDAGAIAVRLKRRLRLQSRLMTAGIVLGAAFSVAGVALGGYTIWLGASGGVWNFVTRGVAAVAVAALMGIAVTKLLPVRATDASRSLSEMLALAIRRAERTRAVVRLGLLGCLVAAVLGLLGTVIRSRLASPPSLSPFVDLAILGVSSIGLFSYGRRLRATAERLLALQGALAPNGSRR